MTTALPFLDTEALARLTGYRQASRQIEQLRTMAVPFRINARGQPIVAVSAIDGSAPARPAASQGAPAWQPAVLQQRRA